MKERFSKILKRIKNFSFYKKKKFYMVLTVLFSLILLADVAVAVFVPAQNNRFGGMRNDFSQMGEFPGAADGTSEDGEITMPEGMELPEGMEMPEDGEMPSMPEGMERPERGQMSGDGTGSQDSAETGDGIDSQDVAETEDGAVTQENAEAENGSEDGTESGDNTMRMPENMDMSEMEDMFQQNRSFLQVIKANWLIIFIIFFILDAASIFMWVFLGRKEKKQKEQEAKALEAQRLAEGGAAAVPVRKPVKKEKHNQHVGLIIIGGMVLLAVIVKVLTSQTGEEVERTEATVYSGTVETGSVSSVLPGTGTLTEQEAVELELPANVEITQWYVSNGDTVAEGDKLAQVDSVSVMSAIVAVQEKLALLDEELEVHEDEEISDTIKAGADGKVKVIYAEEEKGVIETMYESGALMLLSLDGLMAVSMETEAELSAGDAVTVTLSDETEISGKVESMIDGTVVVTVSDDDTDFGESVTVKTEDGTKVGTGELYIHSEVKVTGFTGMVSDVEVSVDEDVSSGEALLTLTDTDYTGEYELLLEKRSELEAQMQTLFQLYQEQYVYASCAGVISGLDTASPTADAGDTEDAGETTGDSSEAEVSANASSETEADSNIEASADGNEAGAAASATQTSYNKVATIRRSGGGIQTMSYTTSGRTGGVRMVSESSEVVTEPLQANEADIAVASEVTPEVTTEPTPEVTPEITPEVTPDGGDKEGGTNPDDGDGTTDGIKPDGSDGTTPDGTKPDGSDGTTPDGTKPDGSDGTTSDGTKPDGNDGTTPDNNTGSDSYYIGMVTAVQNDNGTVLVGLSSANGGGAKQVSLSSSLHVYTFTSGKYLAGKAADIQVNDMLMLIYDENGATPAFCIRISGSATGGTELPGGSDSSGTGTLPDGSGSNMGSMTGGSGSSQFPSGSMSSADMSNQTAYTEVMAVLEEEVENDYSVTTTTWLSVTPQEKMEITITVDEMDILALEEGQQALVTLDAFPGQSFEGSVSNVYLSGTNSSGSSKYQAVVSITREANMLAGMNASVQITLDTKDGVLTVPEAALIEQDDGVYVYTSYDEKTETFGDLVEVTTGVSDGENVEILSGLEEGSEYWYSYLDVVNYSTSSIGGGSFSFGSMFGGGGRGR